MDTNNQAAPNSPAPSGALRRTLAEKMLSLQRQKQKLAQKAAALNKEARKERTGQLIAWGIMVEAQYRNASPDQKERLISAAREFLKDRNLSRALAGFARLDGEIAQEKTSQEKTSQEETLQDETS